MNYNICKNKQKGDFENPKVLILVLNQCLISTAFPIVWFPGGKKTALTGESLYMFETEMQLH